MPRLAGFAVRTFSASAGAFVLVARRSLRRCRTRPAPYVLDECVTDGDRPLCRVVPGVDLAAGCGEAEGEGARRSDDAEGSTSACRQLSRASLGRSNGPSGFCGPRDFGCSPLTRAGDAQSTAARARIGTGLSSGLRCSAASGYDIASAVATGSGTDQVPRAAKSLIKPI